MAQTHDSRKMWILWFQYLIARLIYVLGNGLLQAINRILFIRKSTKDPRNILIFRTGNLGDTFCAIPAMKAVKKRFPHSRLIYMTAKQKSNHPHPIEVLKGIIEFDEVVIYEPASLKSLRYLSQLIRQLNTKKLDMVIYLSQSSSPLYRLIRDMFFFKLAGCKNVCGFQWTKHRFFSLSQCYYKSFNREVDRLMKILEPLGAHYEVSWDIPKVPLNLNWPKPLDSRPVIAIHPTAKFPAKRWPFERFLELSNALSQRYNAFFIVVGGSETRTEAEALVGQLATDALNLAGKTTFLQLAEVLRRCNLLISCDSGPIHVAAAAGTPVIGIYSGRDYPECWYPWGNQHIILRKDIFCQACLKTECDTMDCVKMISIDEVLNACGQILEDDNKVA